jgi:hypothetical protein
MLCVGKVRGLFFTGVFFDVGENAGSLGGMERAAEAWKTFEAMKADLLRSHPERFAVFAGDRLVGIFSSIDDAFAATSDAFERNDLGDGKPLLVVQITDSAGIRLTAQPHAAPSPPAALAPAVVAA